MILPFLSRDREGAVLFIILPLLSRAQRAPREGAVLFADSAEFRKSL
jgi:hypothetical protein